MTKTYSLAILLALASSTGCANFFPPLNSSTGTTVTNTGDFAYVANSYTDTTDPASSIYSITGFTVGTGTLTAISGATAVLPFAPTTIVVNPANSLLYVAGSEVVYGYSISSTGALTPIIGTNNSQALVNANIVSMVISPDGQWLLGIDSSTAAVTIDEYKIGSGGLLTLESGASYGLPSGSSPIVASNIAVAPTGDYVAAAVGTAGDVLFSFNTSSTSGALAAVSLVTPPTTSSADQALTFNSAGDILYVARSGTDGGVIPYTVSNSGATLTAVSGAPFAVGDGPSSILISKSGSYLYVGNKVDSTISAFSIGGTGTLTALSGSPYATGTTVSSLGYDNSGDYILATGFNSDPDVHMYSFDATIAGKLDASTTALTGDPTEPAGAVAIAMTH